MPRENKDKLQRIAPPTMTTASPDEGAAEMADFAAPAPALASDGRADSDELADQMRVETTDQVRQNVRDVASFFVQRKGCPPYNASFDERMQDMEGFEVLP